MTQKAFTAHVTIRLKRLSCKNWESHALVWEHQPLKNRVGRVLLPYSPVMSWTTVEGTLDYKTVPTQAEAVSLATAAARAHIRATRKAHNAYCKRLAQLNAERESYMEALAALLWPKRGEKEHVIRAEVDRLLTQAGRNETDKKHDLELSFSPYSAAYQIREAWKRMQQNVQEATS